MSSLTLRTRIATTAALAVALALMLAAGVVYVSTARSLRAGVDADLRQAAAIVEREAGGQQGFLRFLTRNSGRVRVGANDPQFGLRVGSFGSPGTFMQVIATDGRVFAGNDSTETLPVSDRALQVSAGTRGVSFETVMAGAVPVRVLTIPVADGVAVQIARSMAEVRLALQALSRQLLLVGLIGVALAAGLGAIVARRAVKPVQDLTLAAERVTETQDLTTRIDLKGAPDDELGRLGRTLNGMLASLDQARQAQQQLVADASHELRTPLTSLRTNIEVLQLSATETSALSPEDRAGLLADIRLQLEEFGRLVDGLVELARGDLSARAATDIELDALVETVVHRARSFAPEREFVVRADATIIRAERDRIERAISNLIDNAVKYGGDGPIEIDVRDGIVSVRDHGSGISASDLPNVFDRFYRAPEARGAPGSGLGLAIVRQTAEAHGGSVSIGNAPGGGVIATLQLPHIAGSVPQG